LTLLLILSTQLSTQRINVEQIVEPIVEPRTSKTFPKKIRNCKLSSVGTMHQFIHYEQNFIFVKKTLFDSDIEFGGIGIYQCSPVASVERMYLFKPSKIWVSIFETAVEWVIFRWKREDGTPFFTESEKDWMHKVGMAFYTTIWPSDEILITYKNGKLSLYFDHAIKQIDGKNDISIPQDEFINVMDRMVKTAYSQSKVIE